MSRLSANDRGNNDIKLRAVHRYPGSYLMVDEIPRNLSSYEGCATIHRLKWDPLPPNDIFRVTQHVREEKKNVKWKGCGAVMPHKSAWNNVLRSKKREPRFIRFIVIFKLQTG